MNLTLRNILVNVFYYGVTIAILPWLAMSVETSLGVMRQPSAVLRAASAFLAVSGAALQLWCIVLLQKIGRGTPSPAYPPERLVVKGPYKWCRNPINCGELMVVLGLSGWFASPAVLAYTVLAGLAFHLFIVLYEEPKHLKRFGPGYAQYRRDVNRWIPNLKVGS